MDLRAKGRNHNVHKGAADDYTKESVPAVDQVPGRVGEDPEKQQSRAKMATASVSCSPSHMPLACIK